MEFELVSPQKLLKSEAVDMIVVPGSDGDIGVLPKHSPVVSTLRPGVINMIANGKVHDKIFVGGGFCEISPERCTVLAEEAIPVSELTRSDAEARLKAAKDLLESSENKDKEVAQSEITLAEAMIQAIDDFN